MKKLSYILFTALLAIYTLLPKGLVTCVKEDGSITIEFKNGESCVCDDVRQKDLLTKICCNISECHTNDEVTSDCHDENKISSGDCEDTDIKLLEIATVDSNKKFTANKTVNHSYYLNYISLSSIDGLTKPVDVGKWKLDTKDIINQALLHQRTIVLVI